MSLTKAKAIIKNADAILITAGAGMGVDSGLPDFRGVEGFWNAYPIIKKLGYRFEEMANPKWFIENPALAWAFYGHRLNLYKETIPHNGFYQLLEFVKNKKGKYFVFTSNVDGQFQKAGFSKNKILEVHGSIHHLQCTHNCTDSIWSSNDTHIKIDKEKFQAIEKLPSCPNCQEIARPNILMFSDFNWISDRTDIQSHNLQRWLDKVNEKNYKLAVMEFGAGLAVPTVRVFSQNIAFQNRGTLIRVNPRDYQVEHPNISLKMGALDAISKLI
jgi:NAD-dependent SIR2 family protein deacetylase